MVITRQRYVTAVFPSSKTELSQEALGQGHAKVQKGRWKELHQSYH